MTANGSSPPVPRAPATASTRVPRPLRPLVLLLALLLLTGRATGRGAGRVLLAYDRGASAAGRAVLRAVEAALRALGPLGRVLRGLFTPPLRVVRRCWDRLGTRVLALRVPLGRYGRELLALTYALLEQVAGLARALEARTAPLTRRLSIWSRAVEGAASRLHLLLRRGATSLAGAIQAARPVRAGRRR